MITIRYARETDRAFWFSLDTHLREAEFLRKVQGRRAYVICEGEAPVGVMRYNLFWDTIPFLTFLYIAEDWQQRGFGRAAMLHWEAEMRAQSHALLMTSTQVDEMAQHFYRKLGYRDKGALFFDGTSLAQPQELILMKVLAEA